MTFPTTSVLTNFAVLPDQGPPPTADYQQGILGTNGMFIDTGICYGVDDDGSAQWISTFTLPVEAWGVVADVNPSSTDYLALYISNEAGDQYYALGWFNDYPGPVYHFYLFDQDLTLLHDETEIPMTDGDSFGFLAEASGRLTAYTNGVERFSVPGLSFPSPCKIGLAKFVRAG